MRIRRLAASLIVLAALGHFGGVAAALNALSAGQTCFAAARDAATETDVPVKVLMALTLTETGRTVDGSLQAWPWALNEGGRGHWFDSASDAMDYLQTAVSGGTTNIDIGCFQLNYRWHSAEFSSLEAMMDPQTNAKYAARLVSQHYDATGDWVAAAGAFHSKTPDVAERYLARFTPILEGLTDSADEVLLAAAPAPGFNAYPLLKRGAAGSGGSIVPLTGNAEPLFGNRSDE
jgi:hypothetical protein